MHGLFQYQTRTTEWFYIFFQNALRESIMELNRICVGLVNLLDSLDYIHDKMPKLEQYE